MAEELLKRGWYLGFDGPVTYKNARRAPEVVAVTPLDRIVVETDAPYMSPVPNRGRRNDSRNLPYIVENWRSGRASPRRRWRRTPGTMACGCLGWRGRYEKAFLMVLACLLLAGCGAPSETVTPTDSRPDSALAETNEAAAELPAGAYSTAPAELPAGNRPGGTPLRPRRGNGGASAGGTL